MDPVLADYYALLESNVNEVKKAVDGLPVEALDWQAGPELNTLAVLAVHVAASTRYWIGDVAGQDPSGRDRDAEFRAEGLDATMLQARLDMMLDHSREVLAALSAADLAAQRQSPQYGPDQVTVQWALLHALEHVAQHVGHMHVTRHLWDQR